MPFSYKTILVVGATSGIGLALSERFIENGCHVIAVGRRQQNLDSFVQKHGRDKASSFQFDITDLAGMPEFVKSVTEAHPKLDCVFLNSGLQRSLNFAKPLEIDLERADLEWKTNYTSYLHLTTHFLPFLQSQSVPTSLIFTTSGLALIPILHCPNYCATKAAIHHLIMAMRAQLKGGNVKVIEILPPAVQTELHDQPDIENGRSVGIPIGEFTDAAWEGLVTGEENIPVGISKGPYEEGGFERKRLEAFRSRLG
ncbi:putative oxidoreductase [Hyphodiscus hymeniophilus]|uniref:Oxidoreductase n=1 Tax=Hyphodiscus hymeniophilus TaxID=353542 RepID=A0A9P7B168_9HELO|nr:putative oxidoreductase [Hyphodiscus hymeniophilus]